MKPLGYWRCRISALPEKVGACEYVFQALKLNSDHDDKSSSNVFHTHSMVGLCMLESIQTVVL